MKYIALLSGGKDSCYNLVHCANNGHELVAAASLGPDQGKEELDSYLYQTVGQDAIEFVARALEVPLYRRVISGRAVEQGSEYGSRIAMMGGVQGDETEDLYALISAVKFHHPDVQGVSVGAILSNYQRVRVEHVCRRLSLTPLCYLWQRNQGELLAEMIDAGMEAVLIKVAGIGLTTRHLGKTLADMQPTLIRLNDLYGSHICGEGGEYESLTLDCPLFKHRIILNEVETIIHSDNDFATVAFLRIKHASLEVKTEATVLHLHVPQLLENTSLQEIVIQSQESDLTTHANKIFVPSQDAESPVLCISSKSLGSWVAITNAQRYVTYQEETISIEDEVRQCFQRLQDSLSEHSLNLSHCANINIYLSSMDFFSRMNAVYATFFGISPPARACIAVDLPSPIRVRLDCIAYAERTPTERQALHVQSLSYWAPANIGPYSQATIVDERISLSGQIGLIPSTLALPSPRSLALETALTFQHVDRVTNALRNTSGGGWVGHVQIALYWIANVADIQHVKKACEAYEKEATAPTLFLAVKALPKDALIEKQVILHTGRCMASDDYDDEPTMQFRVPSNDRGDIPTNDGMVHWEVSRLIDMQAACAIVCFKGEGRLIISQLRSIPALSQFWTCSLCIRLFYRSPSTSFLSFLNELFSPEACPPVAFIPCRSISTTKADHWDHAFFIMSN